MHFLYKKKIKNENLFLKVNFSIKFKLECKFIDRFLSLADEEFVYNVDTDIREFVKRRPNNTLVN